MIRILTGIVLSLTLLLAPASWHVAATSAQEPASPPAATDQPAADQPADTAAPGNDASPPQEFEGDFQYFPTTDGPAVQQTRSQLPLRVSLLVVEKHWSQSPTAKKAEADLATVLKDLEIRGGVNEIRTDFIKLGPEVLFGSNQSMHYSLEHGKEFIAWMMHHQLIKRRYDLIPSEANETRDTDLTNAPPFAKASWLDEYGAVPDLSILFPNSQQPFVKRKQQWLWSIDEAPDRLIFQGDLQEYQQFRGEEKFEFTGALLTSTSLAAEIQSNEIMFLDAFGKLRGDYQKEHGNSNFFFGETARPIFVAYYAAPGETIFPKPGGSAEELANEPKPTLHLPDRVRPLLPTSPPGQPLIIAPLAPSNAPPPAQQPPIAASDVVAFALTHAKADEAATTLQQLLGNEVTVVTDPNRNRLLITAPTSRRAQLETAVKLLDTPLADSEQPGKVQQANDAHAARPKAELQQEYALLEQQAAELAQKIQALRQQKSAPKNVEQLEKQLNQVVAQSFAARQKLQQAEVQELEQQAQSVHRLLGQRENLAEQIISRRVQELLDPALAWPRSNTDDTDDADTPDQGPTAAVPVAEEPTAASPPGADPFAPNMEAANDPMQAVAWLELVIEVDESTVDEAGNKVTKRSALTHYVNGTFVSQDGLIACPLLLMEQGELSDADYQKQIQTMLDSLKQITVYHRAKLRTEIAYTTVLAGEAKVAMVDRAHGLLLFKMNAPTPDHHYLSPIGRSVGAGTSTSVYLKDESRSNVQAMQQYGNDDASWITSHQRVERAPVTLRPGVDIFTLELDAGSTDEMVGAPVVDTGGRLLGLLGRALPRKEQADAPATTPDAAPQPPPEPPAAQEEVMVLPVGVVAALVEKYRATLPPAAGTTPMANKAAPTPETPVPVPDGPTATYTPAADAYRPTAPASMANNHHLAWLELVLELEVETVDKEGNKQTKRESHTIFVNGTFVSEDGLIACPLLLTQPGFLSATEQAKALQAYREGLKQVSVYQPNKDREMVLLGDAQVAMVDDKHGLILFKMKPSGQQYQFFPPTPRSVGAGSTATVLTIHEDGYLQKEKLEVHRSPFVLSPDITGFTLEYKNSFADEAVGSAVVDAGGRLLGLLSGGVPPQKPDGDAAAADGSTTSVKEVLVVPTDVVAALMEKYRATLPPATMPPAARPAPLTGTAADKVTPDQLMEAATREEPLRGAAWMELVFEVEAETVDKEGKKQIERGSHTAYVNGTFVSREGLIACPLLLSAHDDLGPAEAKQHVQTYLDGLKQVTVYHWTEYVADVIKLTGDAELVAVDFETGLLLFKLDTKGEPRPYFAPVPRKVGAGTAVNVYLMDQTQAGYPAGADGMTELGRWSQHQLRVERSPVKLQEDVDVFSLLNPSQFHDTAIGAPVVNAGGQLLGLLGRNLPSEHLEQPEGVGISVPRNVETFVLPVAAVTKLIEKYQAEQK